MLKFAIAAAFLCGGNLFAMPSFDTDPIASDEPVVENQRLFDSDEPVVENLRLFGDALQKCPCDKGKK